jgi:predicted phosphodiesterase
MRLALLADIHGNPIALDAVLKDVETQGGADAYWVLGDLAAIGYAPVATLERLAALPGVRFTRGNCDRYLFTGERPEPKLEAAQADVDLVLKLVEVAQSFAWTQGYLTAAGWLDWLTGLPLEERLILPDGTRLLGVHARPGSDDGPGLHPALRDAELEALLDGCEADLVCVGHTHWPLERRVGGVRVVNLGSVSNPMAPDLRASYALLEANASGYRLEHRQVDYDRGAVIEAVRRSRHPAGGFIVSYFLGQRRPSWMVS